MAGDWTVEAGVVRGPSSGAVARSTRRRCANSSRSLSTPTATRPIGVLVTGWLCQWAQGRCRASAAARYGGRSGGGSLGTPTAWRRALAKLWSLAQSSRQLRHFLLQRLSRSSIWARRPWSPGLLCHPPPRSSTGSSSRRARHLPSVRSTQREQHRAAGDRRSGHRVGRESPICETSCRGTPLLRPLRRDQRAEQPDG